MPTSPARPEMRCPRRDAFIDRISPGPDAWRDDRTCSCCGSIHPDDFMTLARSGEAEIGPTDKRYKAYVEGGEQESFGPHGCLQSGVVLCIDNGGSVGT